MYHTLEIVSVFMCQVYSCSSWCLDFEFLIFPSDFEQLHPVCMAGLHETRADKQGSHSLVLYTKAVWNFIQNPAQGGF